MELAELSNLIRGRRSIRRWQDKEVPEGLLVQAIELATWAPNAGNQQNWRFYVVLNRDTMQALADAVQARADRMADWAEADGHGPAARWRERASFFRSAPAAIVVAARQYQSLADQVLAIRENTDREADQMRQWRNLADSRFQSVAAAIAYLLLILHQMGLGAVWMTGPVQAKGEIEDILGVPPDLDVIAFIPVGYPAASPVPRERRPVEQICEVVR